MKIEVLPTILNMRYAIDAFSVKYKVQKLYKLSSRLLLNTK
jgi:hypothetical protein